MSARTFARHFQAEVGTTPQIPPSPPTFALDHTRRLPTIARSATMGLQLFVRASVGKPTDPPSVLPLGHCAICALGARCDLARIRRCIRIWYIVRETVTISLPQAIRRELDWIAKEEGVPRSEVLRQSLEDFILVRRFRQLRQRMMAAAQAQGIYTDEDVFNRVS
jgi:predicted transcriptional regulator